jgi:predicted AlkP superfamily pyrophosphatase or phosphodiesterase
MKILVVNAAALGYQIWEKKRGASFWKGMNPAPMKTIFPALTSPVQASFRTGLEPEKHKIFLNGFFSRELRKTFFWEQSSKLYSGERIWEKFRAGGHKVAQICWQQSLGTDSDVIISPSPIHKHHGGMIQDCYSSPPELYREICSDIGADFNLYNYWGPFTSKKSTEWIVNATSIVMQKQMASLVLTYLPHLDYDLQRYGPDGKDVASAFKTLEEQLQKLYDVAKNYGYEIIIFGDYSIEPVENVIYPNQILLDNGLFGIRKIKNMLYPDLYSSAAFALCDHKIAHLYLQNKNLAGKIKGIFSSTPGISKIIENTDTKNVGDFILVAGDSAWFSYRWWGDKHQAPEYANHVDIHNKPGFDPCELFASLWPPFSISMDDKKIKGSHGLNSEQKHAVFLASTIPFEKQPDTLLELSNSVKNILESKLRVS